MALPAGLWPRGEPLIIKEPSFPPYTTPSLTTNLIFRVLLSFIGNIVCLVPLRILHRNGEFAAVVLILVLELKNIETIIDSLIWRNNDLDSWWPGYGLCDIDPYFQHFAIGLFATCLLTIMRNLAQQVGLLRASPLTVKEKRRRNLMQSLIMFPLPVLQVALTWPLTMQRYAVGPLVGCLYMVYPTWLYMVFFVLAPTVVTVLTTLYAVLTFIRFRQVARSSEPAVSSSHIANRRAQRMKHRLYFLVLSIIVPFTPISILLSVLNYVNVGPLLPFSYSAIHDHQEPYPWNTITYVTSDSLDFAVLNNAYIPILSCLPVFLFFGMTAEAINDYRKSLLFFGLGRFFPKLYQEFAFDRDLYSNNSLGYSNTAVSAGRTSSKLKSWASWHKPSIGSLANSSRCAPAPSLDFIPLADVEPGNLAHPTHQDPGTTVPQPSHVVFRNPFPFRLRLWFPNPLRLSAIRAEDSIQLREEPTLPLHTLRGASIPEQWSEEDHAHVQTRVWSPEKGGMRGNVTKAMVDSHGVRVETALTTESRTAIDD